MALQGLFYRAHWVDQAAAFGRCRIYILQSLHFHQGIFMFICLVFFQHSWILRTFLSIWRPLFLHCCYMQKRSKSVLWDVIVITLSFGLSIVCTWNLLWIIESKNIYLTPMQPSKVWNFIWNVKVFPKLITWSLFFSLSSLDICLNVLVSCNNRQEDT